MPTRDECTGSRISVVRGPKTVKAERVDVSSRAMDTLGHQITEHLEETWYSNSGASAGEVCLKSVGLSGCRAVGLSGCRPSCHRKAHHGHMTPRPWIGRRGGRSKSLQVIINSILFLLKLHPSRSLESFSPLLCMNVHCTRNTPLQLRTASDFPAILREYISTKWLQNWANHTTCISQRILASPMVSLE